MNLSAWRYKNIYDLCTVERAVSGKTYKAGTCYVKLSAVDESVGQIKEPGEIANRYAAMEPKDEVEDMDYLRIVIEKSFPGFLYRYRTTINLQFDTLKCFKVPWHTEPEARRYIVYSFRRIDREQEALARLIDTEKQMKRWYLDKMMV